MIVQLRSYKSACIIVAYRFASKMNSRAFIMKIATSLILTAALVALCALSGVSHSEIRPRARESGVVVGILPTGTLNAITDVAGVSVGHATLIQGDNVRTGVTAILPHSGNLFR